jgi:hypothetical protein
VLTKVDKADVPVRCVPMSVEVPNMLPSNEMLIILMTNAKNFTQFLFVHVRKLCFFLNIYDVRNYIRKNSFRYIVHNYFTLVGCHFLFCCGIEESK